jgi:hypothetical protein
MRRGPNPRGASGEGIGFRARPRGSGLRDGGPREVGSKHCEQRRKRRRGDERKKKGERRNGKGEGTYGTVLLRFVFFNSYFFILFCCSLAGLVNCCVNAGCDWDRVIKIFVRVVKGA